MRQKQSVVNCVEAAFSAAMALYNRCALNVWAHSVQLAATQGMQQ